ncbi:MAG TPA: DNA-binding protein [Bacteroidales bacterium]|nr:DNA-binding protein [Bacteroidales bacterium]HPS16175.1 DNA-binding protein [Bacteroidales bacterium]
MADKKAFILRIDGDVFASLEKWAADEFRSVNGQIEYILTKALKDSGRMKKNKSNEKK